LQANASQITTQQHPSVKRWSYDAEIDGHPEASLMQANNILPAALPLVDFFWG
jgi:hypothetical protein